MSLTDFLLARIAEDEAQANRSKADLAMNPNVSIPASWVNGVADRVLAECEAKRRIVERVDYMGMAEDRMGGYADEFLSLLALPYADHPDCRDEWKP